MRTTRSGRGTAVLALLVMFSGVLTGCSSHGSGIVTTATTGMVSPTEAQQLLDRRSAAVQSGNLKAFLATIDQTNPQLVARQRRFFANLRDLPVQTLRYKVLKADWPAVVRARTWGTDVSVPQVEVATQL